MNLKNYPTPTEIMKTKTNRCIHITVAKQGNQINGVDQYTVHLCYWYAPLRRYYLAAGDRRHCMGEYFRLLSNYDKLTYVELKCHHIGFVLGGGE